MTTAVTEDLNIEELVLPNTSNEDIQEPSATDKKTSELASGIIKKIDPRCFVDPAGEAIGKMMELQEVSSEKIREKQAEAEGHVEVIEDLLALTRTLATLDEENPKLTDEILKQIQDLKDKGVHLIDLKDGQEITRNQLSSLRSSISSHIDTHRTKIQQLFTRIQTDLQAMNSINDSTKKILSEQSDLIRKVLERSIKR